jgi:hypothetical protein
MPIRPKLFLNKNFLTKIVLSMQIPIYTKPTGFLGDPPPGPAIPVIEIAILDLLILLKFLVKI